MIFKFQLSIGLIRMTFMCSIMPTSTPPTATITCYNLNYTFYIVRDIFSRSVIVHRPYIIVIEFIVLMWYIIS